MLELITHGMIFLLCEETGGAPPSLFVAVSELQQLLSNAEKQWLQGEYDPPLKNMITKLIAKVYHNDPACSNSYSLKISFPKSIIQNLFFSTK